MTISTARPDPPFEVVQEALERILSSDGFSGSAQLSRFLRYVVATALGGDSRHLKESLIGVCVFNRSPGYDPKVDPIVRVEARRLRTRLEEYYAGRGSDESVRIQLPKGGYSPTFEILSADPAPSPVDAVRGEVPVADPAVARPRRFPQPALLLPLAAVLILMATAVPAWKRSREQGRLVSHFWSSLVEGRRPVMLIPADSGLVMLQDIVHQPVQLSEYLTGEYRARLSEQSRIDPQLTRSLSGRRYTSIADLEFANRLSHRAEAAGGVTTRYARDVRVEDLKENNLILLGARHSNPWVELFEKDATFRLDHDERTSIFTVRNLRPGAGEPAVLTISPADLRDKTYGIVTYHRNRDGGGRVLVIAGTSVAGTEAGSDFLLNDTALLPWLQKVTAGGEIRGFDILLHARNLSGSVPQAEVIAFHPEQ